MKKTILALVAAALFANEGYCQMVYTAQSQWGYLFSNYFLMPHRDRYHMRHPPVPPLAPWYTYWPAEAHAQPIAPMTYPFWPGSNYQAPPGHSQPVSQAPAPRPNVYYYFPHSSYIYPAR
ncbi:MAG: hypothetical protein EXR99_01230 [Gemmataceae bacterium]|nr:hypothetical protein [Gemmataceae bacterium]